MPSFSFLRKFLQNFPSSCSACSHICTSLHVSDQGIAELRVFLTKSETRRSIKTLRSIEICFCLFFNESLKMFFSIDLPGKSAAIYISTSTPRTISRSHLLALSYFICDGSYVGPAVNLIRDQRTGRTQDAWHPLNNEALGFAVHACLILLPHQHLLSVILFLRCTR